MCDAQEKVILARVQEAVVKERNNEHVNTSFVSGKATVTLGKRMLRNDYLLVLLALVVQAKKSNAVVNKRKFHVLRATSVTDFSMKGKAAAAETRLVQEAPARTIYERSVQSENIGASHTEPATVPSTAASETGENSPTICSWRHPWLILWKKFSMQW